jgi:hypothetical protein
MRTSKFPALFPVDHSTGQSNRNRDIGLILGSSR